MSIIKKRGSIALARSLCYQINGAADDSDDMDGSGYGSVDIAEILSGEVVRLREALAQTQEPVVCCQQYDTCLQPCTPRGEHLAQRTWVGLTDEEQQQAYEQWQNDGWGVFYNAIEAKLKEKNNG